jgi:hypothetical protein
MIAMKSVDDLFPSDDVVVVATVGVGVAADDE